MKASRAEPGARRSRGREAEASPHRGSAGAKILAAIEEATEILRAEGPSGPRLTVRSYKIVPAPRPYGSDDVRRVRGLLGTSQAVLARFLGVNVNTVRSWEQGKRLPRPIACRFLAEIESDPAYWRRRIGSQGDAEPADSDDR